MDATLLKVRDVRGHYQLCAAEAAEVLALDVYNRAQAAGQPITPASVTRRLEALRAHRAGCWCGLCEIAAKVTAEQVHEIAALWQSYNPWAAPSRPRGAP